MTTPALPGLLATIAPYLGRYGYSAVGSLLLLESFGMPVPGEAVLVAAAVYAGAGRLNIVLVAVIAFVAAVAGDSIGWLIGRHGGRRGVARFGRYVLLPPHPVARVEEVFAPHGSKSVPVARFVDGLRQANGIIAGLTGMRFRRFLVLNAIGAALWAGVWTVVGDLAGRHIRTLYPAISRFGAYDLAAVGVLAAALAARVLFRRFIRPTKRKRDHAAFHCDLRLPGRLPLDAGRVGLHPGAVRAGHDAGRGAGSRGRGWSPAEPDFGHRGRGRGQRGWQLRGLGRGPLGWPDRTAPLGSPAVAEPASPGRGHPLVRPVRGPGGADRPAAAGGAHVHLAARRHRRDAPAPVRGLHHDRLYPVDGGAGRGRVRGRGPLAADF